MKFVLFFLLPLCLYGSIQNTKWLDPDLEATEWMKNELKKHLSTDKDLQEILNRTETIVQSSLPTSRKKCGGGELTVQEDSNLFVFMSFSISDTTWLALSKELIKTDGVFLVRGLPNNSFSDFAKKMKHLREQGMSATVQIHPVLFEKYAIEIVPSFVSVEDENHFDKISGNISLAYALEKFGRQNENP